MRRRDLLTGLLATTTASAMRTTAGLSMPLINDETNALASAISPAPSSTWLSAADKLVATLKSNGIWSLLDLFYCFAAPSANACTYNWVNASTGRLTANGTINYSANQYVTSDGSTGFFSSTFNVNSGYAQDGNAHFGYFCLNEATTEQISPFQYSGGNGYLGVQTDDTGATIANALGALNTSTFASFSSVYGSTAGHWVLQQNDTTAQLQMFLDGKSLGTSTQTHSAGSGTVQLLKSGGGSFTTRQTAFAHYGSKLTIAQQLALSKALYTFLAAVDVRPIAGGLGTSTGPINVAPYKHLPTGTGNNLRYPINAAITSAELQCHAAAYPYCMIKVTDPNYVNIFRFEVHPGDYAPFDSLSYLERVQLNAYDNNNFGMRALVDTSFSFFIESGSSYGFDNWCTLTACHDQGTRVVSVPAFMINKRNGQFYFACYDNINSISHNSPYTPCRQGVWHNVRMAFETGDASTGWIKGWFDGKQVWNYTGIVGNPSLAPFWWNMALYLGNHCPGPMAVWYANWETDSSGSLPFASRINNPLPVPPLT